jgi:hypothetical protein
MHSTIKVILIASICFCLCSAKLFASINTVRDAASGDVIYREHFKLSDGLNSEQAFELIQNWFTKNPGKFTRQNASPVAGNGNANMALVEEAFKNAHPLQSIDPESNRVAGRSLVKYFGNANSSIKVMYIEYYLVLEVHGHELTATISQVKYHHFNTHYAPQVIYNWQGGRPFDSSDKFETLTSSTNANADISNLSNFLNQDMAKLMTDLKMSLEGNNALASR